MAVEKNTIEMLIKLGVIEETDEPVNVMLPPNTELNATFAHPPQDDFEAFYQSSAQDPFWATLGHAIQSYARLEQSLCRLFAAVTDMPNECASIIFYKITSANTLHEILEKLAKRKYGETYATFWHSLVTMMRKAANQRNNIVHWRAGIHPQKKEMQLTLPRLQWLKDIGSSDYLNTPHLTDFIAKCTFIQDQVYEFLLMQDEFWQSKLKPGFLTVWQEKFQREVVYTAPSPTPQSPTNGAPANPLPPSHT
jgi:hypothetical protein